MIESPFSRQSLSLIFRIASLEPRKFLIFETVFVSFLRIYESTHTFAVAWPEFNSNREASDSRDYKAIFKKIICSSTALEQILLLYWRVDNL